MNMIDRIKDAFKAGWQSFGGSNDADASFVNYYGAFPSMVKVPKLTYEVADVNGYVPDMSLLGVIMRHTGNQEDYLIREFEWNGDTDEWNIRMMRLDGSTAVSVTRPVTHLNGKREDGTARYALRGRM